MRMIFRTQTILAGAIVTGLVLLSGCSNNGPSSKQSPAGTISFNTVATSANQASTVSVSVSRTGGQYGAVGVTYTTTDNTALAGVDYVAASGTLNWADGDASSKTIPITIKATFSGTRSFAVELSAPTGGASLGSKLTTTVNLNGLWLPPGTTLPKIDFTHWKLTLPIDANGGTGGINGTELPAIEVTPNQIAAGFVDAYFYADDADHLILTAPSNGAVTTPGVGTDHTRSELRELYTGAGAVSNDWNSAIGGTMTATVAVESIAVNSDVTTIGQIHGQDHTFMLLLYRKSKKDLAVDVYATNATGSTHLRTPLVTGVEIGDTIKYSIRYIGDTITTKAEDVTAMSGEKTLLSSITDPSWTGAPVYFKIGAYHVVPNTGNPEGDQTQVSVSSVAVSH